MPEDIKILNPYEIANLQPAAASEPEPEKQDNEDDAEEEILLSFDSDKNPKLYVRDGDCLKGRIEKENDLYKIHIHCRKQEPKNILGKSYERIPIEELKRMVANVELKNAYRPKWRDLNYIPQLLPHRNEKLLRSLKCNISVPVSIVQRMELMNYTVYPWCTAGKIFVGEGTNFDNPLWQGSGVLVGPNLVLTASHAAPWGRSPWWMRFVPAYFDGAEPFGHSYVEAYRGVENTDDVTGLDYIICKLYTPLENSVGWMGSQSFGDNDKYYDGNWTSVGYPGDFFLGQRPSVEYNLTIEDVDNDDDGRELETHVFSTGGWSGGPLWGMIDNEPKVIGIMSGNEEDFTFAFWEGFSENHSVSAGGSPMVDLVKYGYANWPV